MRRVSSTLRVSICVCRGTRTLPRTSAITDSETGATVAFQGNTAITTLTTTDNGYNVSLTGGTTTVTNDANFLNTGTLTLGNGGDTLTFNGGLASAGNASNPSSTNVGGTVQTSGDQIDLGPVTLTASPETGRSVRF